MGLDMYLKKKKYLGWNWEHNRPKDLPDLSKYGIDVKKVSTVTEEGITWRKSNAIHKWFVDTVQEGDDNCGEYYVDKEQLNDLLDIVTRISKDHSLAEELLPTQEGFFFGSYDYDEYYFEDIEFTKKELSKLLNSNNVNFDFYYQSSW